MELKVRPFKQHFFDTWLEGTIQADTFVIQFHDENICYLDVTRIGEDAAGSYAMLEPREKNLLDGFVITVEEEWDEDWDGVPGCTICFSHRDTAAVRQMLEAQSHKVDTNSLNLIVAPSQSSSVHFTPDGTVDGFGGVFSEMPKTL